MDFRIIWTNSAISDLKSIIQFIAMDKPSTAKSVGKAIIENIEYLKNFPFSGRKVPEKMILF